MKICCIKGCESQSLARDMCSNHYKRLRLYGSPMRTKVLQYHGLSVEERLFKRVRKTADCWLWQGALNLKGYGMMSIDSRPRLVHRISWQVAYGPIPSKTFVCHKCDNPICVRPDHLFLGTQKDNMSDMVAKGRHNPGHVPGVKNGSSKLTEVQVRSIRLSKLSGVALAKKYGISPTQISDIRNRKSWRHLE